MKYLFSILVLALGTMTFQACGSDEEQDVDIDYRYHAHIDSPNSTQKIMGEDLEITINFQSHTGETIHHINVSIYKADDPNTVIYSKPETAHIHETSGQYYFNDVVALTMANGFEMHTDYVLKAKAWGMEAGVGESSEQVQFHVHHD